MISQLETLTWILITLILASLAMLVLFRSQLRALLPRVPRYKTASNIIAESKLHQHRDYSVDSLSDTLPWDIVKKAGEKKPQGSPVVKSAPNKQGRVKKNLIAQPFDAFLALDFEGTCMEGSGFDYPNEVIEFPVVLMRWKDKNVQGEASQLAVVDEFHAFVKPTWKPRLTKFCTDLTGITQDQVDGAPDFVDVLWKLRAFMVKNKLIQESDGKAETRFCWCTDGPWDLGDLLTKQCFHSRIQPPNWLQNNVMDVRRVVKSWMAENGGSGSNGASFNIRGQLAALDLKFQGRLHSGIDFCFPQDARNVSRIVTELARRGVKLQPNLTVTRRKRFNWMGRAGQVREEEMIMTTRR
ncbi:hypothetical protein K435DRAFT_257846 [Dendrothele bispora CBS 962.96]|uniref:Exonuclease domain-containing protein n=1 Tax=Dendrothele bispora (strain CBS 962.96) TaxID=1314807 RepID=A0A4S8MVV4_DENBC|nr:hypothetical protein K435DRAFT_257846 [Dendrothele bispora CBS 962.96]